MFQTVVVALDGSSCADRAFELALQLAAAEGSKLAICSVADHSSLYGSPATVERAVEQIDENAKRVVDQAVAKGCAAGVSVQGCVLDGDAAYEIALYADKINAEAIVIGTHGRSGLRRLFMGSVAEGVLRSAAIPVLLVREAALLTIGVQGAANNFILVPVDGSDRSLRALDVARDFAASLVAGLVVCHVVDLSRAAVLSGGAAQLVPGCLEELQSEGSTILAGALERVGNRVSATSCIAEGAPVAEIERLAAEIRPSLIVIGSHGRTGLSRLVMGSVAEGVVRAAAVPVMVVPREKRAWSNKAEVA